MTDPALHSHSGVPYTDFVYMNLRGEQEEKKYDTELSQIGRLKFLTTLELHAYLTKLAWPMSLYTRPVAKSVSFSNPHRIKS